MRSTRFLVPALIMSMVISAAAQNSSQTPTFKSRTDLVLVPVVVHDKEGKHVSGLKADDFILEDNGGRQKIAALEEITSDKSVPEPPPDLASDVKRGIVFTNQLANPSQPKELLIFVIDLVNAPFVDTEQGRRAILGFVASHMSPNRTMALVAVESGGVRLLHSFTTSPTVLSSALQNVTALASAPATQRPIEAQQSALKDQRIFNQTANLLASDGLSPNQAAMILMANFISGARVQMSQSYLAATAGRTDQNIATALESLRQIASWVAGVPDAMCWCGSPATSHSYPGRGRWHWAGWAWRSMSAP